MPTVNYPAWADTNPKKWRYCRRMQKVLRLLHNRMGDWYRDGITQAQYDQLPTKIKALYSFSVGVKLSQTNWDDFTEKWEGYQQALWSKHHVVREAAEDDATADVDIDRDISG